MMDFTGNNLYLGPITLDDFLSVCETAKPSVGDEDIREHVKWTAKYGVEG